LRDDPRARQVGEIVEKAKGQHYQLACGMTFEAGLHKLNERSWPIIVFMHSSVFSTLRNWFQALAFKCNLHRYIEAVHGVSIESGVQHSNQYFQAGLCTSWIHLWPTAWNRPVSALEAYQVKNWFQAFALSNATCSRYILESRKSLGFGGDAEDGGVSPEREPVTPGAAGLYTSSSVYP
jgi:hypothetical protein